MGNTDKLWKDIGLNNFASTQTKEPEPERNVELWVDGKPIWVDKEMTVLCMFYAMTGNPETETAFSADNLLYVSFRMKDLPSTFTDIQVKTLDGNVVCECLNFEQTINQ